MKSGCGLGALRIFNMRIDLGQYHFILHAHEFTRILYIDSITGHYMLRFCYHSILAAFERMLPFPPVCRQSERVQPFGEDWNSLDVQLLLGGGKQCTNSLLPGRDALGYQGRTLYCLG